jgi:hypothetical protein
MNSNDLVDHHEDAINSLESHDNSWARTIDVHPLISSYVGSTMMSALKNPA